MASTGARLFGALLVVGLATPIVGVLMLDAFPTGMVDALGLTGEFVDVLYLDDPGWLVAIEQVSRDSDEGPSFDVSRLHFVDPRTGVEAAPPLVIPEVRVLAIDARRVFTDDDGLVVRSLPDGDLLADEESLQVALPELHGKLLPGGQSWSARRDGHGVDLLTNDGKHRWLDPATLGPAEPLPDRFGPPATVSGVALEDGASLGVSGWDSGSLVREVSGQATTTYDAVYVRPSFVLDAATGREPACATGHVVLHYARLAGPSEPVGPELTAVGDDGNERWTARLTADDVDASPLFARCAGDLLVLALAGSTGGELVGVRGGDGAIAWHTPIGNALAQP